MLRLGRFRLVRIPRFSSLSKFIQITLLIALAFSIEQGSGAGTTTGSRTTQKQDHDANAAHRTHKTETHLTGKHQNEEGYWREVKAIIGGVLGFWGGVGGLGTLFLVIVLSQRYCCRKDDDKGDGSG